MSSPPDPGISYACINLLEVQARQEPERMFAYIPFGGGRHKCAGNAFAILQLKAIFSALLRRYDFDLVGPAEDYEDERANMTIRPKDPCILRYKRRTV